MEELVDKGNKIDLSEINIIKIYGKNKNQIAKQFGIQDNCFTLKTWYYPLVEKKNTKALSF